MAKLSKQSEVAQKAFLKSSKSVSKTEVDKLDILAVELAKDDTALEEALKTIAERPNSAIQALAASSLQSLGIPLGEIKTNPQPVAAATQATVPVGPAAAEKEATKKAIDGSLTKLSSLMDEIHAEFKKKGTETKLPSIKKYMVDTLKEQPSLRTVEYLAKSVDRTLPGADKIKALLDNLANDIKEATLTSAGPQLDAVSPSTTTPLTNEQQQAKPPRPKGPPPNWKPPTATETETGQPKPNQKEQYVNFSTVTGQQQTKPPRPKGPPPNWKPPTATETETGQPKPDQKEQYVNFSTVTGQPNQKPLATIRSACQHVYDQYLSKPYSNDPPFNKNQWDREYKYGDKGETVFRPNHGLAHTLRVAAYAPVVAQYFQAFSPEKEKYQFSNDQLEKIQIALLFAVVGRKNEWGFSDNKDEYMKMRGACVTAFEDWCKQNPGKFSEAEIKQYGESIYNFGADNMKDPISTMMKACHKIDLLRCFPDDRTEKAMEHISEEIGHENVVELLSYADQCIRATGDRVMDGSMLGTGEKAYDPAVFPKASKDPTACLNYFASVTPLTPQIRLQNKEQPQTVSWTPSAKEATAIKNILINKQDPATQKIYQTKDYGTIATSLLGSFKAEKILTEMKELFDNNNLSAEDKAKVMHNSSMLLRQLMAAESPPESLKSLIDYLNAPEAKKTEMEKDPIVAAYKGLMDSAKMNPEIKGVVKDVEQANKEMAGVVDKNAKQLEQDLKHSMEVPQQPTTNLEKFLNSDLVHGMRGKDMDKVADELADTLKSKNIENILNVKYSDLYSGEWVKPGKAESAAQLNLYAQQIAFTARDDILNGKSVDHQIALTEFYIRAMQKSIEKGDFNTAYCLHIGITGSPIDKMQHIQDALAKNKNVMKILEGANQLFNVEKNMTNYRTALAAQKGSVIPISAFFLKDLEFGTQVKKIDGVKVNLDQFEVAAKCLDLIRDFKFRVMTGNKPSPTMDISRFNNPYYDDKKTYEVYKQITPKEPYDITTKMSEVEDKVDEDGQKIQGMEKLQEKINVISALMTQDLLLPTLLKVKVNGKVQTNEKAYGPLLTTVQNLITEISAEKANTKSPVKKAQCDLLLNKLMVATQAIEQHAKDGKGMKAGDQKLFAAVNQTLETQGIKPKSGQAIAAEVAKGKYKLGKAKSFVANVKKAAGLERQSTRRLPAGPLMKNEATRLYEKLAKGMLAGKAFTHKVEKNAEGKDQVIVTMDGKNYNLQEIMKSVNLNHLSFTDAEKKAYVNMLCNGKPNFNPCKPNPDPNKKKVPIDVVGKDAIKALDQSFLERDPKLAEIDRAERLALNIYTTGFYRDANGFMRGTTPPTMNLAKPGYLMELICTTGMAVSGLNAISTESPINSFRGEEKLPKAVLDQRIEAAKTGGITIEAGFVSTSTGQPDPSFGFKHEETDESVGIVYENLTGKNIKGLSAFPHEQEFLIPPTQMQWKAHAQAQGGYLFVAQPVRTTLGLSEDAQQAMVETKGPDAANAGKEEVVKEDSVEKTVEQEFSELDAVGAQALSAIAAEEKEIKKAAEKSEVGPLPDLPEEVEKLLQEILSPAKVPPKRPTEDPRDAETILDELWNELRRENETNPQPVAAASNSQQEAHAELLRKMEKVSEGDEEQFAALDDLVKKYEARFAQPAAKKSTAAGQPNESNPKVKEHADLLNDLANVNKDNLGDEDPFVPLEGMAQQFNARVAQPAAKKSDLKTTKASHDVVIGDLFSKMQPGSDKATWPIVVDPAHEKTMNGNGGMSGAIKAFYEKNGKKKEYIRDLLKFPKVNGVRCPNGEVRRTSTDGVEILHTSAPDLRQKNNMANGQPTEEAKEKLFNAYYNTFKAAAELNGKNSTARELSCPVLGAGIFKWPMDLSTEIAGKALQKFRAEHGNDLKVNFYVHPSALKPGQTAEELKQGISENIESSMEDVRIEQANATTIKNQAAVANVDNDLEGKLTDKGVVSALAQKLNTLKDNFEIYKPLAKQLQSLIEKNLPAADMAKEASALIQSTFDRIAKYPEAEMPAKTKSTMQGVIKGSLDFIYDATLNEPEKPRRVKFDVPDKQNTSPPPTDQPPSQPTDIAKSVLSTQPPLILSQKTKSPQVQPPQVQTPQVQAPQVQAPQVQAPQTPGGLSNINVQELYKADREHIHNQKSTLHAFARNVVKGFGDLKSSDTRANQIAQLQALVDNYNNASEDLRKNAALQLYCGLNYVKYEIGREGNKASSSLDKVCEQILNKMPENDKKSAAEHVQKSSPGNIEGVVNSIGKQAMESSRPQPELHSNTKNKM